MNSDRDILKLLEDSLRLLPAPDGTREIDELLVLLEKAKLHAGALTADEAEHINKLRIFASGTLQKQGSESLKKWDQAQMYLFSRLEAPSLHWSDVTAVNKTLTEGTGDIRTQPIYGQAEYLSSEHLPSAIKLFCDEIFCKPAPSAPVRAFLIYLWISTLHPFSDGNGRSGRLVSDFILLQNGFLPAVYLTPVEAQIAPVKNQFEKNPEILAAKYFRALLRSYEQLEKYRR